MKGEYTEVAERIEARLIGIQKMLGDLHSRVQSQPRLAGALRPTSFFDHNGSVCMVLKQDESILLVTPFSAEDITQLLQQKAQEMEQAWSDFQ